MREGSTFYYFLTDHLGSVVGVTDSTGTMVSETRYLPFGEIRTDVGTINQTDYGYTFQRNVPDMGLMDYKARSYSSLLGRFVQPDSIVPNFKNPQTVDRYSYVNNRPINFNDPSGHIATDVIDWLKLLTKIKIIVRNVPSFIKIPFTTNGQRILTIDPPHGNSTPFYHLNTDVDIKINKPLLRLDTQKDINHKNIEPLVRDVYIGVQMAKQTFIRSMNTATQAVKLGIQSTLSFASSATEVFVPFIIMTDDMFKFPFQRENVEQ